jgi:hypothetical protein
MQAAQRPLAGRVRACCTAITQICWICPAAFVEPVCFVGIILFCGSTALLSPDTGGDLDEEGTDYGSRPGTARFYCSLIQLFRK